MHRRVESELAWLGTEPLRKRSRSSARSAASPAAVCWLHRLASQPALGRVRQLEVIALEPQPLAAAASTWGSSSVHDQRGTASGAATTHRRRDGAHLREVRELAWAREVRHRRQDRVLHDGAQQHVGREHAGRIR